MNALAKRRILTALKYTWPFYLVTAIAIPLVLNVIFGITHRTPSYKTLTIFVSGEVNEPKKLKNDMLEKYKEKDNHHRHHHHHH